MRNRKGLAVAEGTTDDTQGVNMQNITIEIPDPSREIGRVSERNRETASFLKGITEAGREACVAALFLVVPGAYHRRQDHGGQSYAKRCGEPAK